MDTQELAQEVASFLPLVQSSLEMAPQPIAAHALQAGPVQSPLGTALKTMHIHLTRLTRVKGWVESQVFWCNVHIVRVGAWMVELIVLQLV
jgi:hypothetical protein